MKTIGLTGGIGSGKTTVARILEQLGAIVINADAVGHDIYRPNTDGWRSVTAAFGTAIVAADGTIDRKRLGAIVFNDHEARTKLNGIVHPLIANQIRRRIDAHRAAGARQPIVVEAAVLIEANWVPLVDEVWVVTTTRDAAIARVTAERGLSPAEVQSRIDAQISDAQRQQFAHVVIDNTGPLADVRRHIEVEWARIVADS